MRLASISIAVLALAAAGCPGGGNGTINGRVTYDFVPSVYNPSGHTGTLNFGGSQEKPVRNGTVQLRQGTNVIQTTQTDDSGNYSFDVRPVPPGDLTVVAVAQTATPQIQVEDNTDGNAIWAISTTFQGGGSHNLRATHGWTGSGYDAPRRSAAPFAILDSMYTASRAYIAARPSANIPLLKVNWSPDNVPQSGDKAAGLIGTSHFSPQENEIYILGKVGVDTDEFDNHVIVHEWGHFFEHNLSRSDSPGGAHSAGDVLDPRLAFGEGYGNAISGILLNDPIYSDTYWNAGGVVGFGFDLAASSPTDDPYPSAMSEMSVMRALYQMRSVGLGVIYDTLVGPQKTTDALTTIGSFVTGLKAQSGVSASTVNSALAAHGMGPISTQWGDGDTNADWNLRDMYTDVSTSLPASGTIGFDASEEYNKWEQNQYYVVQGNGAQITATAISAGDVALRVFRAGTMVTEMDYYAQGGTEVVHFNTQAGAKYVVVLYGFKTSSSPLMVQASISFTSP